MLAALIRPIFNADSGEQARALVGDAIARPERPRPKVAAMLERAEEDLGAAPVPLDRVARMARISVRSVRSSVRSKG
jgi:hypothetical protein